mgnify:CR=1 FL=1
MTKKALITGITGQDGAYLSDFLLKKGYKVYGAVRRTSSINTARLSYMDVLDNIELVSMDLGEITNIQRTIEKIEPDEIYNLAAQSFVQASYEQPIYTSDIDGIGVTRILETIRNLGGKPKFYQASTSEMFGKSKESPQNEDTPFYPRSPYGIAKLYSHWMTINYRESWDMHACSGILFNHESPLRGSEFVTRKISLGMAEIKNQKRDTINLGNLSAERDWGFAGDYVEAMWLMLQKKSPMIMLSLPAKPTVLEILQKKLQELLVLILSGILRVQMKRAYVKKQEKLLLVLIKLLKDRPKLIIF